MYTFAEDASNNPTFYANLKNPQSLNKYQYSYNSPLRYTDADGHDPNADPDPQDPACGCKKNPAQEAEAAKESLQKLADAVAGATGISALADAIRQSAKDSAAQIGTTIVITTAVVTTLVTPKPVDPNAIPAVPAPPPSPITQAKGRDKAQPTTPPLTGPEKAKADRERKRSDPRTKDQRRKERQDRARDKTGPNDPHDNEGPHHRRPDPKTIRPGRKFEE